MDDRPSESDVELVSTEEMLTMFEQFISDGETSDDGSLQSYAFFCVNVSNYTYSYTIF